MFMLIHTYLYLPKIWEVGCVLIKYRTNTGQTWTSPDEKASYHMLEQHTKDTDINDFFQKQVSNKDFLCPNI